MYYMFNCKFITKFNENVRGHVSDLSVHVLSESMRYDLTCGHD
jgi:hypothetical protein